MSEEAPAEPHPVSPPPAADGYARRLLVVVMLAVMGFGSLMTIVTVSLTPIADDLGTSRATLGWVVTGLMLAMAVTTPLAGKLGDIAGHRRVFLWGLGAGVVTTALCGLAWNAGSLIAFRVLFGVSGALVMPNGMALMMHAYGPARRATAMGWFQFAMTGAPTVGLVVGGPLVDVIGWRPIFFAFAVISAGALAVGAVVVRDTPRGERVPLDYLGAVTLATGVLALLVGMTRVGEGVRAEGTAALLDPFTVALFALGVAALVAFVAVERRARHPMLKLRYFRRRTFAAPLGSSALVQFAYMGGFVVIPILLHDVYGWTVGATALILAFRPGAFSLMSPIGGALASRRGERLPMVLGGVFMVASMLAFAGASAGGAIVLVIAGLLLSGVSAGIAAPANVSMVASAVDPEDLGIANGMSQQMLFIGMMTGIQSMLVLLGDRPTSGEFARTFLFGAGVAAVGLVVAVLARAPQRDRAIAPTATVAPRQA